VRRDEERLRDVLEAIDAVNRHAAAGRAHFDADELVRVWCLKHIEIVGEALPRVTPEFKAAHPELPWRAAAAMRNQLIHGYFQVDWNQVWNVVERELPSLRSHIQRLLSATA
jgi:uncharacterized protein with HEPN domain